jgi:hypothetical protein
METEMVSDFAIAVGMGIVGGLIVILLQVLLL